jgi:pimeloyl-ACP methyl ester carboxylesterase
LSGTYVVVLDEATPGRALRAMMQSPLLEFWTVVGHGSGGALAARLALTLQPTVKALILLAEPMPKDVDMAGINIYVVALYGQQDSVVTPASVEASTSRMPGTQPSSFRKQSKSQPKSHPTD